MGMMGFENFLERLTRVRRYRDQQGRAPHKPLVLMHALAGLGRGRTSAEFRLVEAEVGPIIVDCWNDAPAVHEPFVRLLHDGIWQLSAPEAAILTPAGGISVGRLRKLAVRGGFPEDICRILLEQPQRITWAARILAFEVDMSDRTGDVLRRLGLEER